MGILRFRLPPAPPPPPLSQSSQVRRAMQRHNVGVHDIFRNVYHVSSHVSCLVGERMQARDFECPNEDLSMARVIKI